MPTPDPLPGPGRRTLLSLFDGTGSICRPFLAAGWDVRRLNVDGSHSADIVADIRNWDPARDWSGPAPDVIFAGPPCEHYSSARTRAKTPRNLKLADSLVRKTVEIIEHFHAANPRQIVSFSPARMLVADVLISSYNKWRCEGDRQTRRPSAPWSPLRAVPCELSEAAAVALGNCIPRRFVHECISGQIWGSYEEMVLSTLASVETVRAGVLKYLALVRTSVRNVSSLHTVVALAMTGWQRNPSDGCACGVWAQALELISCFVPDAETALSVQDETRVSAYIRTIMDISEERANRLPITDTSSETCSSRAWRGPVAT